MQNEQYTIRDNKKEEAGINLVDLFFYLLSKWKWILLSVLICGGFAWYKYAKTPFTYFRSATVIIKDPSNKVVSAGLDRYENLINKVNVKNEILQFRSMFLMRKVVERTHADISYRVKDRLRMMELYTQSPVTVTFPDVTPEGYMAVRVTPKDSKHVTLTIVEEEEDKNFDVQLNDTIVLPEGRVVVAPTNYYDKWIGKEIQVQRFPLQSMVDYFLGCLSVRQEDDESSILKLSMQDSSPVRAEDMLNTLVTVYNEEAIRDKNLVAVNTANFINDRLILIENELGGVEDELEAYRKSQQITQIASMGNMFMQENQKYNTAALELETQLRLVQYIKDYLTNPANETELIPVGTGINDVAIENQISQYNSLKLKRDKYVEDSGINNPVVQELNNTLKAMRQGIIRAVDNTIAGMEVKKRDAEQRERRALDRVTSIPTKEKQVLSIERQQKIKESLYIFLLNKREENALTQAMADNNARMIDGAYGSNAPIAPNRNKILLLGILIGIAIPCVWFLALLFLDTRVKSRKDLEVINNLPFLGEVPLDKTGQQHVKAHGDDSLSEALRIVRTNLSFMTQNMVNERTQAGLPTGIVVTFTSFAESAGKTFVAENLARSLSYAGKKVIVIDLDIRKRSLTKRFRKLVLEQNGEQQATGVTRSLRTATRGITDYIADSSLKLEDLIIEGSTDGKSNMPDFLPAGTSAPNPAELLLSPRLDEAIEALRAQYTYIIVDNVPYGIIADAAIANRVADLTAFVIRAGRMDKRMLPEIANLHNQNKLKSLCVVLNGMELHKGYGYYGYGYGYGTYGYGYGYGYGQNKKKKKHRRSSK